MDCTLGWPSMTMHCGQCFLKIILDAEWGRIMTEDKYTNFFLLRSADLPKTLIKLHLHDYPPPLWITTTTTNNISDPKFLSSRHWSVSNCPHNINNFLVRNSNLCWGPLAPQAFSCDDVLWDQPSVIVWQCHCVTESDTQTEAPPFTICLSPERRRVLPGTWWGDPDTESSQATSHLTLTPLTHLTHLSHLQTLCCSHQDTGPSWTGPTGSTGVTYPRFGLIKVT